MADGNSGSGAAAAEPLEAARAALARGDAATAVALLREVVAQGPGRADAREMLGAALCQAGDVEDGCAVLAEVVDEHPTSAPAHLNLASALRQAGRTVDAHHHLNIALRLDPHYERALVARQAWSADFAAAEEAAEITEDAAGGAAGDGAGDGAEGGAAQIAGMGEDSSLPPGSGSRPPHAPSPHAGPDDTTTMVSAIPAAPAEATSLPGAGTVPTAGHATVDPPLLGSPIAASALVAALPSADHPALPPGDSSGAAPSGAPSAAQSAAPGTAPATGAAPGAPGSTQAPKPGEIAPEWLSNLEPAPPDLRPVLAGMLSAPAQTLTTTWPAFLASPTAPAQLGVLFALAALLWAAVQVFDPGAGAVLSAGVSTADMIVGVLAACALLLAQTAVFTFGLSLFGRLPFSEAWRALFPAFVVAWALPAIPILVLGLLISFLNVLSGLFFLAMAALASFVLNMIIVLTFYRRDFGKLFVLMLAAQLLGDGIAAAIMVGVGQLR